MIINSHKTIKRSIGAGGLANMLFFTFVFISTLFAVNVVARRKCAATNKYVQHSSGSASFTVYTGCAETGDVKPAALI